MSFAIITSRYDKPLRTPVWLNVPDGVSHCANSNNNEMVVGLPLFPIGLYWETSVQPIRWNSCPDATCKEPFDRLSKGSFDHRHSTQLSITIPPSQAHTSKSAAAERKGRHWPQPPLFP